MKYRFACLSAFLALTLPSRVLRADLTDEETKSLRQAQQSYNEGAFELANTRINSLLKKYPKSELGSQAEILQARSLYQLGRSEAALAALNTPFDQVPEALRADYLFWQAESLLDLGKWPDAEQKYRALLTAKNAGDHADQANLGLAWALFKQGRESDALPLIQSLIKDHGGSVAAQQAQLLQAKILLAKKQFKEAIASLESLLAATPSKAVALEANVWLGETYAAIAQNDKAVAAYQMVTGDPQAFPRPLVARAWEGLGRAQHTLGHNDQAMLAYEQTYRLTQNPVNQLNAFRSFLACARDSNQLPEAVTKLQEFAKSSDAAAPAALLAIGSALAENHDDDRAIGILESLLVAYPASSSVPVANQQLGQLYARTGKIPQAIKALNLSISAGSDPDFIRNARYQLGYVLLKQSHDYAAAAAQFALVSPGTDSMSEDAAYDFLLAQASLGKLEPFLKAQADFEKRFPQSSHAKSIALAQGQLQADAGKTDEAKATYNKSISQGGASADQEALLKALADLQYQTNDLEETIETCKKIVEQFPNDALAAAQRGVLVSYELKKITAEQAEDALIKLVQKYNTMPGAPEAYFRIGEFYFVHQDYVRAQDAFQQLITNYPTSADVDTAYYYAGRSAFAHQDYAAAQALLGKVPDTSHFKPAARLWEGRVLQQQHNFSQAAALFDAVLATEKSGELFVEASLLKGEALFAQGSEDPAAYGQALAAFDQILKSKDGQVAERNEAAVRSGKCLELLGRKDEALGLYLDVLYGKVSGTDPQAPAPPEFSWQLEAGSQAGRIQETRKDWRGAIEVYKRLEQIGGAHAQDFHDLVNKLRRDNYIYE